MPFDDQCSDFSISVNILHDLMESRGDDGVAMNLLSSQQQVIRSIDVNNITRHPRSQVPDLAFEFDISHRARTISFKVINSSLSGTQSMSGDSQVLHDPVGARCSMRILDPPECDSP